MAQRPTAGLTILFVTYNGAGLGVHVVVPLNALGVLEFDLVDVVAANILIEFGVVNLKAWVLGLCLLVELFQVTDCTGFLQAGNLIRTNISVGGTGSNSQGSRPQMASHR